MYSDVPKGQSIVGLQVGERRESPQITRVDFKMAINNSPDKLAIKATVPSVMCRPIYFGGLDICHT